MIHTHPHNGQDKFSDDFSAAAVLGSDIQTAIYNKGHISMISFNYAFIKIFEFQIYDKNVVRDANNRIYILDHNAALEVSIRKIYIE